jgi:hypothetical protein
MSKTTTFPFWSKSPAIYIYTVQQAILCLTGTIVPHTTHVAVRDAHLRAGEYATAIAWYLGQCELPLHFIENSAYPLESDPRFAPLLANGRVHVHRFTHHTDVHRGKGFQEFYMLDRFMESQPTRTMVVKCTGRYVVRNIAAILRGLHAPLHIDLHRRRRVAITALFAIEAGLYVHRFKGLYAMAHDDAYRFIEHVVYDSITAAGSGIQAALLPQNAQFEGTSGSEGTPLSRNRYKMMLRGAERRLLRGLGANQFYIEY